MKRIYGILLFTLVFAWGCNKERKVIPRDEMVSVLVQVHLMDGATQIAQYNPEVSVPDTLNVYEAVLENYGYTKAQFDSSIQYYSKDLRKFDRIYQEVLSRLNKMETEVQEQQAPNPDKEK